MSHDLFIVSVGESSRWGRQVLLGSFRAIVLFMEQGETAIVAALIGSFLAMLVALIFPCLCYLSILKGKLTNTQIGLCMFIIIFGLVSGCCGTYSAISRLADQMT
ncbi:hypothetical protein N665_0163s0053 [Sinapis alba]|nr:hypothetical protein N665_0163s0053 [Sinapis alba]